MTRACGYCGKIGVALTLDHIVPRSRGGTDEPDNLILACWSCNSSKGNRLLLEWVWGIERVGQQRPRPTAKRPRYPYSTVNRRISWRLRELLAEAGISQNALAKLSGVSFPTINAICRNRTTTYNLRTAGRIMGVLGCGPGDLLKYDYPARGEG